MFTHLHVHTEYSLLDGMCRIKPLIERAKELGMDSLAITDHGVMHGAVQFYQAARDAGIKPIIGCEVYVAPESRTIRGNGEKRNYHLVLLAKDQTGYRNLVQMVSEAHINGFYYKPRIDKELLAEHSEGLVGLSACIGGEIPQLILSGMKEEARQTAIWYRDHLEDFYLEIQRQPIAELEIINQELIAMSRELGIPMVATNDVHYIRKEDASAHDILLCIGTNSTVNDANRMKMEGDYLYMKSPEEMQEQYRDIPEALENTEKIAAKCNLEMAFGRLLLPEIEIPEGKTPFEYLSELCWDNLPKYYPDASQEIKARLEYELDVIDQTQFANYFLVVWDIVSFVRENRILFGVRGSAAASIVLHCLGITSVDPMKHALVFERFLNIERKEMPDIDLDFQDDRREEVIAYVTRKYGQDHVAQIITFGTLGAKAAIRDVGRALGMAYGEADRVARLIPVAVGMSLDRAMEENPELKQLYRAEKPVRDLIDMAKRVEGIARHASTHAAGIVIAKEPLTSHVPLQRASRSNGDDTVMTQFDMSDIAHIGLLKMDFLGLINLSILGRTLELISKNHGVELDLNNMPMDDGKTFALLAAGDTTGVFQLEGAGMRRYIRELKPTVFSDISAMVALYRPGPMEHIPTFIKAKHGEEEVRYPHPSLEKFLEETYGVIVYQDQVLFIVREFAGYSLGQADIFRKAMGKKIASVMAKEKEHFMRGAQEKGYSLEQAQEIFSLIEPFAGYAFNKAHSVSYALIAYQTAYLKANYPVEYITAFLIANSGQAEKVANAVAECNRLSIEVLPPNIQKSREDFTTEMTEDGSMAIRFGLTATKNVGYAAILPVFAERDENGPFKSIEDFCRRADLSGINRRTMESLIKAGAFDELGDRGTLLNNVAGVLSLAQREQHLRESGQTTMFDLWGQQAETPLPTLEMEQSSVSDQEKAAWEKELLGVTFSKKQFDPSKYSAEVTLCGSVDAEMHGESVTLIGEVASVISLFTRKDSKQFVKAVIEDISGSVEVVAWPRVYDKTKHLWEEGKLIQIAAGVRDRDGEIQVSVNEASAYTIPDVMPDLPPPPPTVDVPVEPEAVSEATMEAVQEAPPAEQKKPKAKKAAPPPPPPPPPPEPKERYRLTITLKQTENHEADSALLGEMNGVLQSFPGCDEVIFRIENGTKINVLQFPSTGYCPELYDKIAGIIGKGKLKLETLPA